MQISSYKLPRRHRGEIYVQLYSFFDLGAKCEWVVTATLLRFTPGNDAVITGEWVGSKAGLVGLRIISFPPVFDPRTIQPVASRYTD